MKIQGQSYESVVDCVSFSNRKLYPKLHLSTHRIDKSAVVKIYSPDCHPHPSGDHPVHPLKIDDHSHTILMTILSIQRPCSQLS